MTRIVAICGSLRGESSNATLLRIAAALAPPGVELVPYFGMGELPHFNPDLDGEGVAPPASVAALRELLIEADGILISTPEYAHGLPGSLKNLLDWLVSVGELVGKPVASINASPAGGRFAQQSLAEILRTMNWCLVEEACLFDPFLPRRLKGESLDEQTAATLKNAMAAFVRAIR